MLSNGLRCVKVEEWPDENGNPSEVYFRPALTMKERGEIADAAKDGNLAETLVMELIIRARNSDDTPMFTRASKTALMRTVDSEALSRVLNRMNREEQEADAGKP
jgi:hypothetical protein